MCSPVTNYDIIDSCWLAVSAHGIYISHGQIYLTSVSRPAVRVREKKGKDHQSLKESLDAGFVGLGVGDVVGLAVGLSVGDFVGLAVGLSVGDFVGLEELEGSRLEVGDSEGLGVVGCVFLAIRDNQSKFCPNV